MPTSATGGASAPLPPSAPERPVRDALHGQVVVDPYRYLEDLGSADSRAFVARQNAHARAVLETVPGQDALRAELAHLLSTGSLGVPEEHGGRLFYTRREANQDQPVLYVSARDGTGERVLYDPAADDQGGLVALDWWYASPDGTYVVFGTSRSGNEWSTLRVREVATGRELPDRAERARASSLAFEPDGSGFYYTHYPSPADVPAGEEYFHNRLFHHVLGEEDDPQVFGADRPREELPRVTLSRDGRLLLVESHRGWARSDLWWLDRRAPGAAFRPLWRDEPATFAPIADDGRILVVTNLGAPRFRVLAAAVDDVAERGVEAFSEIVPEDPDAVLQQVAAAKGGLVAVYMRDATAEVRLIERGGQSRLLSGLPPLGSVPAIWAAPDAQSAYILYESFSQPPCVYRLDTQSGALTLWRALEAAPEAAGIRVRQAFYTSKDGTRVPLFLLSGRELALSGTPPHPVATVLTGYGGFRVISGPVFTPSIVPWLRRGGIYAIAGLRGGLEYGEAWHQGGMLARKQNVFDDFIAAAEYLVHEGYTRPDLLGISGASNGGLLVGAALTQRPDLFRAVRCGVPLLDMLRYHMFRLGGLWTSEYGSPDDPDAFAWLRAYSPYHNVRAGVRYPAVLLTTADSDSRVDPMHALKMTALLQRDGADLGERPVLLRVDTDAGHGAGKPVRKTIDELVDTWSFLASQLDPDGRWR
jgi:prolyl oligopeptidase